jgi:hypothetical protein
VVSTVPVRYTLRMFRRLKKALSGGMAAHAMSVRCVIVVIHYMLNTMTCKSHPMYKAKDEKAAQPDLDR